MVAGVGSVSFDEHPVTTSTNASIPHTVPLIIPPVERFGCGGNGWPPGRSVIRFVDRFASALARF